MELSEIAVICKTLSDSNRLKIVQMLTQGERCGCELLKQLQIGQPTLSHHMKVLENCDLVFACKDGKWNHYHLNCARWTAFRDTIEAIRCVCAPDKDKGRSCCS